MKCAVIPGAPRVAMCGCRRSSRGSVRLSLLRNSLLSPLREWIKEVVGPRGGVKAEIAGGATGSFFLKAVGMLLRFGVGVVLARLLARVNQGVASLAVLAGLGAFGATWVYAEVRGEPTWLPAFWVALFLIPLGSLSALRQATLRGLHHVILGQIPEFLARPALAFLG